MRTDSRIDFSIHLEAWPIAFEDRADGKALATFERALRKCDIEDATTTRSGRGALPELGFLFNHQALETAAAIATIVTAAAGFYTAWQSWMTR